MRGVCVVRFSAASTADRLLPGAVASWLRPLLQRVDAVLFAADERGASGRASFAAFVIRVVSAAIALVSQVFMARWMGGFDYGVFVLVWTVMIMVGDNSCFGFQTSIIRFIPEYRQRGEAGDLRGVMRAAQRFVLATSLLVAAAGLAGVWLVSDLVESYYVLPFYLGLACVPSFIAGEALRSARARRVLQAFEPEPYAVHALYPHSRHLAAKVRVLVDFLVERYRGTPRWEEGW